ncbi:preprotein translocase subunit YajC [Auritidibacter ignavus]|uniref:Preprotein translocase subunit YajC n=1 Tax=Auritidibacter ignavus TaxID=678932 RepID=A0AAJ6AKX6_9MICC|nr:preprotein translocase subunit YajC [Auritidibacter ignavus]WGH93917.1 preprotein translocase subunit YajC [Auritidibacter ignavus]
MHFADLTQLVNPLAQNAEGGGGFGAGFLIVMLVIFGLLIFLSMRGTRKQQKKQMETRQALAPGVEVMTAAGIFGTVISVNHDDNKVVLEVSPGNSVTVHLQTIAQVIEPVADTADSTASSEPTPDESNKIVINSENRDATDTQASGNPEDPREEYGSTEETDKDSPNDDEKK